MAFDPKSARPVGTRKGGFDPSNARPIQAPEEATLGSAAAGGFEQLKSAWGTTFDAFTQDPNEVAQRGIREQQRIAREQGVMPSFSRVGDVYEQQGVLPAAGQVISDAPTAAAGQAANIASTIGGGVLGAKIGSIAGPVGAGIGAGIGAIGTAFPPLFAENLQAQAQEQIDRGEQVDVSRLKAGVTAAGQAALEAGATFITLGGNFVRRIIGSAATKTDAEKALVDAAQKRIQTATTDAQRSLPGAVGRGAARGAAAEMPVEVAQSILTRAQAGADLLSEEALADYGENAYLGGLVGGTFGGVAGPMDRGAARKTLQEAGIDYETGAPVQAEQSRQEREALVRQEQMNVTKGQERREIARREREAQWAQPVDVAASPEALTQELADLRAIADDKDSALRGPAVNSRIKRIEAALDIIQNEPARRARMAAQDTKNLSPALQAKRSAEVFMRDAVAQRSDAEIEQELAAIKGRRDPESEMLRNALRDELGYRTRKSRFDREQQVMTTVPTLDTAQLAVRRESLAKQKDRSYEDNFELAQINEELRQRRRQQRELSAEVKRIREQNEAARPDLLPVNRAQSAAEAFEQEGAQGELYFDPAALAAQPAPTTQTEDMPAGPGVRVRRAPFQGVGAKSTYGRQLGDLDLTNPDQFEQAQRIAATAQSDAKLSAQAKRNIQQYVDGFARQEPLPSQQGGLDFEAPAVAGAPVFSQELAAQMGFGKNTLPFKSVGAQNLDPSDAKQRETLKEIIDTWFAQGSYKAQRPALQAYRQQLEQMDGGQDARPATGTLAANETVEPGADTNRVAMAGRRQPSAGAPTPAAAAVPSGPDRAGLEPAGQATEQPAAASVQPDGALSGPVKVAPAVNTDPNRNLGIDALGGDLDTFERVDRSKERREFAKAIGATGIQNANMRGRESVPLARAILAGDTKKVLSVLAASKNPIIAEIAKRATRLKGLTVVADNDAAERSIRREFDANLNTVRINLALLDMSREAKPIVDQSPTERVPELRRFSRQVELGNPRTGDREVAVVLLMQGMPPTKEQFYKQLEALENGVGKREDWTRWVVDNDTTKFEIPASFDPDTNTISAAAWELSSGSPRGFREDVMAHELAHALTLQAIQKPSAAQSVVVRNLKDLYEFVKEQPNVASMYGVSSIEEFVAEGFSNPEFQYRMSQMPYKNSSAWSKFTQAVARILGIKNDSAFTEFLTLTDRLTTGPGRRAPATPRGARTAQVKGPAEPSTDVLSRADQAVQAYPDKQAELAALQERIVGIDKAITDARLARSQASGPFSSAKVAELDARLAQLMADKDRAEADWAAAGGLPDGLVNAMRSDARVLAQADGDTPGVLTDTLATRLELGDVQGALQHMADNADGAFNTMETLLARRVLDMRMTLPSVEVVPVIEQRADGSVVAGQYDPATDTIRLAAGEADSHTFLHELVHAYTHKFLQDQQRSGYTNPNVKGLMDVYAHVLRMRPDLRAYGVTNVSEFAAEAMSNRQFQLQLMGIPYRKQTAWSWFAKAVKGFFGVKDADPVSNTAWAAIVHVDGLMRPGRQAQEAGVDLPNGVVNAVRTVLTPPGALTPDEIRNIPPASPQQHIEGFRMFGSGARQGTGVPARVTRARAAVVDSMAPIADKMATVFNDGLRDAMGNINPLNFMRQAADAGRMSMEFFRRGGLRRRPDGYWEVYDLKDANGNPLSVMAVTDKLAAWGKANGLDYKGAKARAATVFEYLRLNDLRAYNAELEADAQAFEALNTAKGDAEADRLRSKMIALHGTDADIDARVSEFERSPELQEIRQILNETRFNAIDAMVASGRLSEEQGAMWKKNINYVPFNRVQEVFETSGLTERIGRSGLADLGSIPAIKGSYRREVANSIDNYMHSLSWMVNQSLRNTASRETLDAMVDAGFATKLAGGPSEAENTKLVVTVYNEGKPVHYEMDNEYDMAAFSHNRLDTSSDAMRAFTALARIMRASITAMPTFSINQVMQDTQRSSLQGGTRSALATAARTLTSFASEFKNAWAGKRSTTADRLHGVGIVGNVDFNPINPIDAIEYEAGVLKSGVGRRFLHTLEQVAKASDQAARQAVYERTMLETKDEALAITRAREVINYNRRGSSKFIQVLTHTVPFFNAYAQGMDLIYRGLTGIDSPTGFNKAQAKKYVGTRLAMMMTLGTVYALAMSDDEDYENADQFVRDRAWILPRVLTSAFDSADGRHTPLAIPAPRDWGFIFKGIPERIVQYFKEREEGTGQTADRAIGSAFKTMGREFLFEPIPTAVKPFLEHLTNYSFGFGRAIVPQSQANAPAAMQYGRTTSEFAKVIGRELNVSPLIVDNYLSNMFGIMGKQATIVADMMIDGNLPERPFDKVVAGTAVFTAPEVGNRPLTEFYELREKILEAGSVWSNFEKDPQLAQDLLQDRMKYLPWRSWAQSKTDQLATLRAVEEQVRFNEGIDMTPRERRMYLKELAEARNAIVADVGYVRNALESQE